MKSTFQILLLALLLSACSSLSAPSTISSTITSTATIQKTATSQPTKTPTIPATETPISQKIVAITATHEADLSIEATGATFGKICQPPANDCHAEISPDGQWITMECEGVDN